MCKGLICALAAILLLLAPGESQASYRLFDDFEDENLAPINGQDGWVSWGGDNQVVPDPADAANQVLHVPSASSVLHKSLLDDNLAIPDGTARMLFMRLRVSQKQTFSLGLSPLSSPDEFSDFAPEIGMANSSHNLDLCVWDDGDGRYEILTQLESDRWYNVWVLVDTLTNNYRIWLNDVPGAFATPTDQLRTSTGDEVFSFRSGAQSSLRTFYLKTAGGSSGTNYGPIYIDDIYVENINSLDLRNPTTAPCAFHPLDFDGDCDVDQADLDLFVACASGPAVQAHADCGAFDLDADNDVDHSDFGIFQRGYSSIFAGPMVVSTPVLRSLPQASLTKKIQT